MFSPTNLTTYIGSEYPAIWLETVDYFRGIEQFIEAHNTCNSSKELFTLDPIEGLCAWTDEQWKPVLKYYEQDEIYAGVHNLAVAAGIVVEKKGIFLVPGDPDLVGKIGPYILSSIGTWRERIFSSSNKDNAQFFVVGKMAGDKMDPLVASTFWTVDSKTLDTETTPDFYTRIGTTHPEFMEPNSLDTLVKHTNGFIESQALSTVVKSIRESERIDPVFVEEERRRIIGASGILEVIKPSIKIADIGGLDNAKSILTGNVWINQNIEEAAELGLRPQNRVLLIGVPGTGKSALCEATADMLGYDMVKFGVSKMMNKFIGQSEENMRAAFAQMNAMAPVMVWIDELGRDLSGSHTSNDGGTTDRVHGELLTGLQEMNRQNILMAAANRIDGLPPEMLRADRFDRILFVGFPSEVERLAILSIYIPGAPQDSLMSLLDLTESFTGAEIKAAISEVRFRIGTSAHRAPTIQEIGEGFKGYKNRVWLRRKSEIISMYKTATVEWDWASADQLAEAKFYCNGTLPNQQKNTTSEKVII